jgi:hypothetical protein
MLYGTWIVNSSLSFFLSLFISFFFLPSFLLSFCLSVFLSSSIYWQIYLCTLSHLISSCFILSFCLILSIYLYKMMPDFATPVQQKSNFSSSCADSGQAPRAPAHLKTKHFRHSNSIKQPWGIDMSMVSHLSTPLRTYSYLFVNSFVNICRVYALCSDSSPTGFFQASTQQTLLSTLKNTGASR